MPRGRSDASGNGSTAEAAGRFPGPVQRQEPTGTRNLRHRTGQGNPVVIASGIAVKVSPISHAFPRSRGSESPSSAPGIGPNNPPCYNTPGHPATRSYNTFGAAAVNATQ